MRTGAHERSLNDTDMLNHYRKQRASGNPAARFCTEAVFDRCAAWCVAAVDAEETNEAKARAE